MNTHPPSQTTATDPQDNPYIRTYAKDYARLSGKGVPNNSPKPVEKKKSNALFKRKVSAQPTSNESLITHSKDDSVATPELSELEHEAEVRDAHMHEEQQAISDELSALDKPEPEAVNLPPVRPIPEVAASVPMHAAEGDTVQKKRESLLQRLHAHAAAKPISTPAQTYQPILPQKIEGDLPSAPAAPIPEPVPEPEIPPPAPVAAAIPNPPRIVVSRNETTPFHSFSTDFADQVDGQQASTFSVLAAEKDTARAEPRPKKHHLNVLPILAGIVLIVGSCAGVAVAYHYMQSRAPIIIPPSVTTLVTPDKESALTGNDPVSAFLALVSQSLPQGDILVTYSTVATSTPKGGTTQVPGSGVTLFETLFPNAPDILTRNLGTVATVGVIHAGTETRPFFLLQVGSYERTFAGMLDWESTMPQDFATFYPPYPEEAAPAATSTIATSSLPVAAPDQTLGQFADEVVDSHSVRVLRDTKGRSLMLYGYTADRQVLIIARDENAFTELLNRLSASGN